jgi:3-deoxy-7-phosphoheptulonate synthase
LIIHINKTVPVQQLAELAQKYEGVFFEKEDAYVCVLSFQIKTLPAEFEEIADSHHVTETDIQLSSRHYLPEKRTINMGRHKIGGKTNNTIVIAGPCAIESEQQIEQSAQLLKELGISVLRAGCYKPRTSPYSFQGMGIEGLKLLAKIREMYGFSIITEVRDATHADDVIQYADIVQIGAKAMYDHGILRKCGKIKKPVLLKRGFGSTLQEFVQAAEFILSGGNEQVILCERGIRTFETKTRFTLDLCGVAFLKEHTNLPIVLDPSHAMGYAYGVPDLARACLAMDVDGLLIETHPDPKTAKSDASQQLDHGQFRSLFNSLLPIAQALGKKIV